MKILALRLFLLAALLMLSGCASLEF